MIANILWFVLAGVWMALGYVIADVLMCLTIIGIASFELVGLALTPFGKTVVQAGAPLPPEARIHLSL